MRVLIVGAGAIGSLLGHRLATAGHQVTLVGRPPYAEAVQRRGLGLEVRGETRWVRDLRAVINVSTVAEEPFDLLILTVKAYDTATAARQIAPLVRPGLPILVVQNGVGGEEIVMETLPDAEVLSAVITLSVEVMEPGWVRLATSGGGLTFAPTQAGQGIERFANAFAEAGFRIALRPDHQALKWSKLLLNILGNALPAILDLPPDVVFADRRLFALERAAFREAVAVMRGLGQRPVSLVGYPVPLFAWGICSLPGFILQPIFRRFIVGGRGGKMPSLHIDLSRGKPKSEVEYLNGAVVRYAPQAGVEVPVNTLLYTVLTGIVQGEIPWDDYRGQPERILAESGLRRTL